MVRHIPKVIHVFELEEPEDPMSTDEILDAYLELMGPKGVLTIRGSNDQDSVTLHYLRGVEMIMIKIVDSEGLNPRFGSFHSVFPHPTGENENPLSGTDLLDWAEIALGSSNLRFDILSPNFESMLREYQNFLTSAALDQFGLTAPIFKWVKIPKLDSWSGEKALPHLTRAMHDHLE